MTEALILEPATPTGPPRAAAVLVTFNRKQLLIECLNGLLSQTTALDRIYIIDNASTDGTGESLRQAGFLTKAVIRYVPLRLNVGGAGGFAAGLEMAYNDGYDWFWLMDDDVEPYPDGLAQLLAFHDVSGCIHGRRKNPDGTAVPWGVCFSEKTVTTTEIPDRQFLASSRARAINTGCFEGMLVSRKVVSQIGFPDADFFITWDDTYYGYLASRVTTVSYVNAFVLQRKLAVESTKLPLCRTHLLPSPFALFYFHRNRWLLARKLGVCRFPFWVATGFVSFKALIRELVLVRSVSRARIVVRGVLSGMRLQVKTREPRVQRNRRNETNVLENTLTERDSIHLPGMAVLAAPDAPCRLAARRHC
jgi:rhamnopyranosyl-N-acetylglucosaminyl-diphospho-decaprenol beta-1,3/1,4-galactofuranosyltransferase